VAVTAWGLAGPVAAQTYPAKPVTVIVPFAAGGSVDVLTRIITSHMAKTLGQSFIMDNVAGAGGTIGVAKVARSTPDGYTLVAGSSGSNAGAYSVYEKLSYPADSFTNLGITAIIPALVLVKKDLLVHNF
jgi:tripartite-type tricarboxylate transporter receptor subunit TctC